jgi:Arc/MetJ-type ribon-helix-helix transcriptional regulator
MRATLTISLPRPVQKQIKAAARSEGVTQSEYVRRAVKADLFRRALQAARRELVPKARARKIYTDEDVFKIVS